MGYVHAGGQRVTCAERTATRVTCMAQTFADRTRSLSFFALTASGRGNACHQDKPSGTPRDATAALPEPMHKPPAMGNGRLHALTDTPSGLTSLPAHPCLHRSPDSRQRAQEKHGCLDIPSETCRHSRNNNTVYLHGVFIGCHGRRRAPSQHTVAPVTAVQPCRPHRVRRPGVIACTVAGWSRLRGPCMHCTGCMRTRCC